MIARLIDALQAYRQYRLHHSRRYAARIALGIARGLPF